MTRTEEKLSVILTRMAESILAQPLKMTSDAGAHAALLLAHVAWNQEVDSRRAGRKKGYLMLMAKFEADDSSVRANLKSNDCEELIAELRAFKRKYHPGDKRFIVMCGTNEKGNVQVTWEEEK